MNVSERTETLEAALRTCRAWNNLVDLVRQYESGERSAESVLLRLAMEHGRELGMTNWTCERLPEIKNEQ